MPSRTNTHEIPIKSLTEFINQVNVFGKGRQKVWFRGHSEFNYKLEPSIYRKPYNPKDEVNLSDQFKSRAIPYLNHVPEGSKEYWQWLFLMQHYKMPTRLLDWTESALIGLAFAVIFRENKKRRVNKEGSHVWCLDPLKLNSKYNAIKEAIPNITENEHAQGLCRKGHMPDTGTQDTPVAVYGPQNNPRIVGQKGVFTIFPAERLFDFDDTIKEFGVKLIIKTDKHAQKIATELFALGISESMVFPELDFISLEIKREFTSI